MVFCEKPKEVVHIEVNLCMTNKCFDSTQIYVDIINNTKSIGLGHRTYEDCFFNPLPDDKF